MIQTLFGSLEEEKKTGFLDRMKQAVTRTRENLTGRIDDIVSIGKEIDRLLVERRVGGLPRREGRRVAQGAADPVEQTPAIAD